jgi:UDP-N-acetylmuramate dehydrogenase
MKSIVENTVIAPFTTFKIGGRAKYFLDAKNTQDILDGLRWAKEKDIKFALIGAGSNLLVSDEGIDGLVIRVASKDMNIEDTIVKVDAGVSLSVVTQKAFDFGLVGMEWAPTIPGNIGGSIRGNAGAFGGEMKDIVKEVTVFDKGEIQKLANSDLEFGYRRSVLKNQSSDGVLLSAIIELKKGNVTQSRRQMIENITKKSQSQPVGQACSGCIFQNFEGSITDQKVLSHFAELENFRVKGMIPAAFLIDKAGLKGEMVGGVEVSAKHANYIVNTKGGTYKDVMDLIKVIKKRVKEVFGVEIHEEVVKLHQNLKQA